MSNEKIRWGMSRNDALRLVEIMDYAGNVIGRKCCNDWTAKNTPENFDLYERVYADGDDKTVEEYRKSEEYRPRKDEGHLCFYDWMLLGYFQRQLEALIPPELGVHRLTDTVNVQGVGKLYLMKAPEGARFAHFLDWKGKEIQVGHKRGIVQAVDSMRPMLAVSEDASGLPVGILFEGGE